MLPRNSCSMFLHFFLLFPFEIFWIKSPYLCWGLRATGLVRWNQLSRTLPSLDRSELQLLQEIQRQISIKSVQQAVGLSWAWQDCWCGYRCSRLSETGYIGSLRFGYASLLSSHPISHKTYSTTRLEGWKKPKLYVVDICTSIQRSNCSNKYLLGP